LLTISVTAGLSAVGFFAQSQNQSSETDAKTETKKAKPELVQP